MTGWRYRAILCRTLGDAGTAGEEYCRTAVEIYEWATPTVPIAVRLSGDIAINL